MTCGSNIPIGGTSNGGKGNDVEERRKKKNLEEKVKNGEGYGTLDISSMQKNESRFVK